MRTSLRLKLFLVLLAVASVAVTGTWLFMERAFEQGFVRMVEARQQERVDAVIQALAGEYREAGGWHRLRGDRRRWLDILLAARGGAGREPRWARHLRREPGQHWPPAPRRGTPERSGRTPLEFRMTLMDREKRILFGQPGQAPAADLFPVTVDGATVGYLGVAPGPALNEVADIRFVEEQKRQFILIAGAMVLATAALALPLAGGMTGRIRRLAEGARALAAGRYATRVTPGAGDELGRLAVDFNELAAALDAAESSRRQWSADIAHELRTPLAVLRAELEALQDGVRPLDEATVQALHGEVLRLGRLVDDLFDLSLADLGALSYRKQEVLPLDLLAADLEHLAPEFEDRGIRVQWVRAQDATLRVLGDPDRLSQLWSNLLTNTLRYTGPGGLLRITATRDGTELVVDLEDSAPGVPEEHLDRLFDRFHRVDASRSRDRGGAGLGLAICNSIVAAHGGTLHARRSSLGGLLIQVRLPLAT